MVITLFMGLGVTIDEWTLLGRWVNRWTCVAMKMKLQKGLLWGLALAGCLCTFVVLVGFSDNSISNFPEYGLTITDITEMTRQTPCEPVTKVAFLKVHKAGSSTIANILQRFGYTRDLNFVVPRKHVHQFGYNYIGNRGDTVSRDNILPLPPGGTYDILWNHVTYNHDAFREIMPPETRYVTILREPFDQFVSAFEYYVLAGKRINGTQFPNQNPLAEFLESEFVEESDQMMSHFRNSQAFDMGFQPEDTKNKLLAMEYIQQLDEDFDLVMLVEYFDESLVLLKRRLCWSLKDILYFHHNRNPWKKRQPFLQDHYERHRNFSSADYELYEYFRKIFWDKVWKEGPEFFEEVQYFKKLLSQLRDYCLVQKELVVPDDRWGGGFTVNSIDCIYMQMPELWFHDTIMSRAKSKLPLLIRY